MGSYELQIKIIGSIFLLIPAIFGILFYKVKHITLGKYHHGHMQMFRRLPRRYSTVYVKKYFKPYEFQEVPGIGAQLVGISLIIFSAILIVLIWLI